MMTKPEVVELDIFAAKRWVPMTMSTAPVLEPLHRFALFGAGAEAAQLGDFDGKLGHPSCESVEVLFGEHGRRHQHGDLVAAVDRFEGRPHGDFGLAVADIAADQAVHRLGVFHVALEAFDRGHSDRAVSV